MQLELAMPWGRGTDPAVAALVGGYRGLPGVHDEMIDAEGRVRPHWLPVLSHLAGLGAVETATRFAGADRYLRESGVVYRVYGEGGDVDRPWPLAHLPIVLTEADWEKLAEGVVQRARLFEAVLGDLMGDATLVADGAVPAAIVAGNPEFLRPLAGVRPADGHHLHLYAADVSRAPDGRWWVLADRTQAPSGAGYAIENRIALSRVLPELFDSLGVERLGPFFQALRSGLVEASSRDDARVALFSPGPWNETYFEHAFLARCLGFQLVEGGDLVASSAGVSVRTVEGLEPVDVLLRRVDADFSDPLELNPGSRLGVPGLTEAVRAGRVVVANALGSGLVEAPALTGYLPGLARRLLGEQLLLPNVATWWCGEPAARATVLRNLQDLALAPAFGRSLPGILDSAGVLGARLSKADRERYVAKVERRGVDFVGREPLRLSTAPIFDKGRLAPRPFSIRIFVARTPTGWRAMPGGLARFSEREDARFLSMQRGGRSGDVWVIGTAPATRPEVRLLPEPDAAEIRRDGGILPARAADNLFWFGRYVERAETTLRLLRGLDGNDDGVVEISPDLARRIARLLVTWGAAEEDDDPVAESALWGDGSGSVASLVAEAHRTGAVVRDRLSPDAWRALIDLRDRLRDPDAAHRRDLFGEIEKALRTIAAIVGLAHENMNRREGWRFLDLGRRIERAIGLSRSARRFAEDGTDVDALDLLLDLADGRLTYRMRYLAGSARRPVLDLVLLDEANPRAVAFQVARIREHLAALPGRHGGIPDAADRIVARLTEILAASDPAIFDTTRIEAIVADLMALSDAVTTRCFGHASPVAAATDALEE
ncbi:circularly permuted type 2 ATP-grasp protein [Siculibacillus lacustris]|uniref:circularly permuted type 2 ATP-grasp protein n=1 Tax=Siculibacillus lacustris TaxID=1549641 RepID=UPI001D18D667|nr:circularly permuted type 2 ATP-grasp protein [Siculibacillus lacustris]